MTATNKPMTGAQLDELMAVAMRMQSDSEKMGERSVSMFAYAVQVAVLEIRETRSKYEELQSQNADLAVQLANAESKCRELAAENAGLKKFCKDAAFDADYEAELGMERGGFTDALNNIKTTATDAFLAEVRASELDSLAGVAETMLVKFSNQRCSQDMHEVVGWKMVLQQASNRAAQLRKGAEL
ncbi:hypothetical protein BTD03_19615 [Salmonella enterica]|nr:hypothetical protein [Salmonella enterica]EDD5353296.1 hypothetical protein [Salmonella enterica subsp. enterica serovar Senftenberg]EDD5694291.1 hypothetical protein [Salmonella enterica subsp. enterica serovar Infantis]EDR0467469.1 hypothetical protein [Salmonella enterica subsp. enterica serovar Gallinarum]EDX1739527.1 hypothetical protein [Salmonella enterica subsp. enterica serovar Worthington]HCZ1726358.1 hypothetical protein [Salmonella enterica subsp. enterica serovar Dublin str. 07